jgi:membrane-associated protein
VVGRVTGFAEHAAQLGPLALFLASLIEYVFPPFPGDLAVVAGAWYATHGGVGWPVAFAAVTAGSLVGAAVDWRFGVWLGPRLEHSERIKRFVDPALVRQFEARYRRWGAWLLVINRFLPAIRGVFFVAAGVVRLPLWKVLLYGGASAALWNAMLLAAAAFLARNEDQLLDLFAKYNMVAGGLLAAAIVALVIRWAVRRRRPRGS